MNIQEIEDLNQLKACSVESCHNQIRSLGYCNAHYLRHKRYGDATNIQRVRGESRSKNSMYHVYMSMIRRCNDQNSTDYAKYGGRGISVCLRWKGPKGFNNFVNDMGERPSGLTIDRIDPNGDYSPLNCRWASWRVQAINQRMKSSNKSGVAGVYWDKSRNRWVANIRHQGEQLRWYFADKAAAINKREELFEKYYEPLLGGVS